MTTTGTSANEILIGGTGNDTLTGGGGNDVFHAGAGNDMLVVPDLNARLIDGGSGIDTLKLTGTGHTFDFTVLADTRVQGIEAIDFTGSGDNSLSLGVRNVLNFSITPNADLTGATANNHTLVVIGDAGDTLDLHGNQPGGGAPDAVWQAGATQVHLDGSASGGFDFYDLVQDAQVIASVAVDHRITTVHLDLV